MENMNNLKLYKKGLALLVAATLSLSLSGCCKNSDEEVLDANIASAVEETVKPVVKRPCDHLSIRFGDEYVTFKECQGYDISVSTGSGGVAKYHIYNDDGIILINGVAQDYNWYDVDHQNYESDVEALQECKTLKK